ncbi:MAG TPA: CBS domain-containing protein [Thermomicrobiales bacterium]|nr:CBS domain-containing protein [Thermomicrobiales bacterium]
MANQRSRGRQRGRRRWSEEQLHHGLDLADYLDEMVEVRAEAESNLALAGERALKVLDRFLANLAGAIGLSNERPGMGDSIRYLEHLSGTPRQIATQADRFRDTRNALAHNPDITLRPEAAARIIDGVETIVRMAAERVRDLAHGHIVTALENEPLADARDRLLEHHYDQLVVVDADGGVVDLLTDRDIVLAEANEDVNGSNDVFTVADAIAPRGHPAIALLPVGASAAEAVGALQNERTGAVVLTQHGRTGEPPLGIITRKDLLKTM